MQAMGFNTYRTARRFVIAGMLAALPGTCGRLHRGFCQSGADRLHRSAELVMILLGGLKTLHCPSWGHSPNTGLGEFAIL